jgi:hypothetical protein
MKIKTPINIVKGYNISDKKYKLIKISFVILNIIGAFSGIFPISKGCPSKNKKNNLYKKNNTKNSIKKHPNKRNIIVFIF